jgi:peroxiredoxin
MKLRIVSLAFAAVIASACGGATTAPATRTTVPAVVPLASVQQQVAGKPVVYLFTAPGCASCADQARALAAAARGRPSVQLVGVDLTNDHSSDFAAYITAIGLADSQFVWTFDQDGSLAHRYGIVSLSSSVFVASDGRVRFTNTGPKDAQTLDAQLGQLS